MKKQDSELSSHKNGYHKKKGEYNNAKKVKKTHL